MDITIVGSVEASDDDRYFHVYRHALGEDAHLFYGGSEDPTEISGNVERMPKEILSIRAAEYGLAVENPRVMDMVLLEHLVPGEEYPRWHPLFTETLKDALKFMDGVMDKVRDVHGHPIDSKFLASAKRNVSNGLTVVKNDLLVQTDDSIIPYIEENRERQREVIAKQREQGRKSRYREEAPKPTQAESYEIPRGRQ